MVKRGLELLLPGGALATERQRLFNNIAEDTSREPHGAQLKARDNKTS
jgi:hypothetical protein